MDEVQPSEACSHFWKTAELVAMTFTSLDTNSLSQCARVNRFISEHALDALYRNDANLWDVLRILAPLRPKRWDNNERLVFTERLRPHSWARFRHYSSRIRSVIGDTTPNALSQESMLDLSTTIPTGETLLPSLSEVYWQNIDDTISPLILFLLHEKVKAMVISVNAENIVSDYFLENMARKAPAIEIFHFWLGGEEPEADQAIAGMIDAVRSLACLRSLDVHPFLATPDLLRELCSKRCLRSFWASDFGAEEMEKDALQVIDVDPAMHPDFPRLCDVAICSTLVMEPSAQKMFHSPSLISLHIQVVATNHISEFIPHISSACTQLRHFSIMLMRPDDSDDPNNIDDEVNLTMTMLNPLLAMKHIEVLVIDIPFPPLINDHELSQFATAFPRLRHFELCPRAQGAPLWKTPTLAALIPFATHCSKLVSIGIFMDASIPPPSLPLDGTMFSSNFKVMHVSHSKITDHCWVVDFLMSILSPHASLNLSRYSSQLRHVGGAKMADIFSAAVWDDGLDEDSLEYRREWENASNMLDSLKWTRDAMSEQRAEIQRLKTELNAFIE
ncbi:hypothetical protein SISNIDRAFT_465186 [Sistotremastrum niveocremeum HHB9708]|uniref:F-box domain-containing protein n=1 Tax=Sistotremastrum niveocremeum HHB9708 TaxID=1314777 RepID=A0A164WCW4_9AGAM|nr:hypothetical protein SISNIDRAFT_465186 [Sistotremastrum niveocremeum HHB9708]